MPPSDPRSQKPRPLCVAAMPTMGWFNRMLRPPRSGASPDAATRPSGDATHAPLPVGVADAAAGAPNVGGAASSLVGTPSRSTSTPPLTGTAANDATVGAG